MENWLLLSILTMLCWGVWGLILKLASKYFQWYQVYVSASIATLLASITLLLYLKPPIDVRSLGFVYSLAAGTMGAMGAIFFYIALGRGKASIVVPITALYPVITLALSLLLLQEKITATQAVGVALAILSLILVSAG